MSASAWKTAEEGDLEEDIDTLLDEQNVSHMCDESIYSFS